MLPLAFVTMCGIPVNPEEIERLLHVMNETKVEFTIPDEGDPDDGHRDAIAAVQADGGQVAKPNTGRQRPARSAQNDGARTGFG